MFIPSASAHYSTIRSLPGECPLAACKADLRPRASLGAAWATSHHSIFTRVVNGLRISLRVVIRFTYFPARAFSVFLLFYLICANPDEDAEEETGHERHAGVLSEILTSDPVGQGSGHLSFISFFFFLVESSCVFFIFRLIFLPSF